MVCVMFCRDIAEYLDIYNSPWLCLSIVCMRICFARMYDRYHINIRIVTEIWSMSTKESPDHDEESGDAAPGSWGCPGQWWRHAVTCAAVRRRVSSLFVSIMERSLTISPRDRLKPHAAYLIIAVSQSSSPPPSLRPGSVSDMHTATWAQSRTLDSGLILRWSSK